MFIMFFINIYCIVILLLMGGSISLIKKFEFPVMKLCKHGIKCDRQCQFCHPLGKKNKRDKKYNQYLAKEIIVKVCYDNIKDHFKSITLDYFYQNFDNFNFADTLNRNYNGLRHKVEISSYPNEEFAVKVNFAAKKLSGGTLRLGLVQEEIGTLESTLLIPFAINENNFGNLPIEMQKDLSCDPFVIRTYRCSILPPEMYGRNWYLDPRAKNINYVERNIICLQTPIQFDWVCIAFPDLSHKQGVSKYTRQMIHHLFLTSFKAFVIAIVNAVRGKNGKINVYIGNIGCGAFGNNVNVSYSIMILSLYSAITFTNTPDVFVTYCTHDQKIYDTLYEKYGAVNIMEKSVGKPIMEILDLIFDQTQKYATWHDKI